MGTVHQASGNISAASSITGRAMIASKSLVDAASQALGDIEERRASGNKLVGLSTGITALDNAIGGLRKNALYIVGGRTGTGKSSLAMTMGMNVARENKSVLYCSLEMPATLLSLRVISAATGLPALDIEQGRITDKQLAHVRDATESFRGIPLFINDHVMTSDELVDLATYTWKDRGLDFLIVDYLSLLTDRGDSEVQRLEGIVGRVRALATDLDIPILGVVQLNRDADMNEGNRPALRNIRYSDRISHDAFAAWMVHRPAMFMSGEERARYIEQEDNAELILDKNRQGPTGVIPMTFYPKQMRWDTRFITPVEPKPSGAGR